MVIQKVINNNIVSACDDMGREVVVMGRGLGFGVKPGMGVDESKIEKVFRIESGGVGRSSGNCSPIYLWNTRKSPTISYPMRRAR